MQGVFVARAFEKFWRLFRAHPAVSLALASLIALPEVSSAQTNYNRIALQRWYAGNTSATFATGSNPYAVAFDGTSIWVASWNSAGSLTKINASDGTTTAFNLGTNITQLAFDGSNIWAVEEFKKFGRRKVRASDGVPTRQFPDRQCALAASPSMEQMCGSRTFLAARSRNCARIQAPF